MVKLSIKLFFAGLIVQTFLMNAIGFFGAIFASIISKDMTGGREILYASQPYGILSGVLFALSIYYFSKIDDRKWVKVLCVIAAITAAATSFYGFLDKGSFLRINLMTVNGSMLYAMLFLVGIIILKKSNILESTHYSSDDV